jgi:hypothetical protein
MRVKARGVNVVRMKLATGETKTYYYHRSTGTRLAGVPDSPEFLTSLAAAELSQQQRNAGTLAGLIREFEGTKQWRRLAESTKKEYRRVFTFWDGEYGTCPYAALEDKAFRNDVANGTTSSRRQSHGKRTTGSRSLRACFHGGPRTGRCASTCWTASSGPTQVTARKSFGCRSILKPSCGPPRQRCGSQWSWRCTRGNAKQTFAVLRGLPMTEPRSPSGRERRDALAGRLRLFECPARRL